MGQMTAVYLLLTSGSSLDLGVRHRYQLREPGQGGLRPSMGSAGTSDGLGSPNLKERVPRAVPLWEWNSLGNVAPMGRVYLGQSLYPRGALPGGSPNGRALQSPLKCKGQSKEEDLRKGANLKVGSPRGTGLWERVHLDLRQNSSVGLGSPGVTEGEEGNIPKDGAHL